MDTPPAFETPNIEQAFAALPAAPRETLLAIRARIYALAAQDPRIGPLSETLKWGQPSYTTARTKTATPIRLGLSKTDRPALLTHCQSGVINAIAPLAPPDFHIDGNRALHLPCDLRPTDAAHHPVVTTLIQTALTYRL